MPRINLDGPAEDGFRRVSHPNLTSGIFLPDAMYKSRKKEVEDEERFQRGKLFSNWHGTQYSIVSGTVERNPLRASHEVLKYIARRSVIDADIIQAIISAMQRFARICHNPGLELGFRVVHRRAIDPNFQPTAEEMENIRARCKEMEHLIYRKQTPASGMNFSGFLAACHDDALSIDRKVMVKMTDRKGRPKTYHWLPGETIRPVTWYLREWVETYGKEDSAFYDIKRTAARRSYEIFKQGQRDMAGNPIDLTDAAYVQIFNNDHIVAVFKDDQIAVDIVRPYNAVDEIMFGYSPLEASLDASILWMMAWDFQRQLLSVTYPESLLVLRGDYSEAGLESFRNQILASYGNSHRLPIIAGGPVEQGLEAQLIELRKSPQDMLFDTLLKFIIALKCAFYRIHPSLINCASDAGPAENALPQERNYVVQEAYEEGIRARMDHFAEWLTDELIYPYYDDLMMIWEGFDLMPQDARIMRELQYAAAGVSTVDEVRATMDRPKWEKGVPGEDYGDWPPSPIAVQITGTINANKMQAQMQQQQANPPGLSQPQGEGGGDFGGGQGLPGPGEQGGAPPAAGSPVPAGPGPQGMPPMGAAAMPPGR